METGVVGLSWQSNFLHQDERKGKHPGSRAGSPTRRGSPTRPFTALACRALDLPVCQPDEPYDARELESCDAGITECDALIAQTGSVLVTSRSGGGRALSVLPPHHIVLARRDQLIPDLPSAFALVKQKYQNNYPSFISLITG